jgi:hypothetical protein
VTCSSLIPFCIFLSFGFCFCAVRFARLSTCSLVCWLAWVSLRACQLMYCCYAMRSRGRDAGVQVSRSASRTQVDVVYTCMRVFMFGVNECSNFGSRANCAQIRTQIQHNTGKLNTRLASMSTFTSTRAAETDQRSSEQPILRRGYHGVELVTQAEKLSKFLASVIA